LFQELCKINSEKEIKQDFGCSRTQNYLTFKRTFKTFSQIIYFVKTAKLISSFNGIRHSHFFEELSIKTEDSFKKDIFVIKLLSRHKVFLSFYFISKSFFVEICIQSKALML